MARFEAPGSETVEARLRAVGSDLITAGELLNGPCPPLPAHALPLPGTVGLLTGPSDIGKSWLALQIALSVAAGRDVWKLGLGRLSAAPVLVLNGADPNGVILDRLLVLSQGLTRAERERVQEEGSAFLRVPAGHTATLDALAAEIEAVRPSLVILDPPERCLAPWRPGTEPVMPVLLDLEAILTRLGAACIMVVAACEHDDPPFHAPWRGHLDGFDPDGSLDQPGLVWSLDRSACASHWIEVARRRDGTLRGGKRHRGRHRGRD